MRKKKVLTKMSLAYRKYRKAEKGYHHKKERVNKITFLNIVFKNTVIKYCVSSDKLKTYIAIANERRQSRKK